MRSGFAVLNCVGRLMLCALSVSLFAALRADIRRTVLQRHSRVNKIAAAARGLIGALPDYEDTGQLSLPLEGGDSA